VQGLVRSAYLSGFRRADERTRTADLISSYEFACVHTIPSWCVRKLRFFRRFSVCQSQSCVHCVPACASPVAVRFRAGWAPALAALLHPCQRRHTSRAQKAWSWSSAPYWAPMVDERYASIR
jgi:hypothetical protein